MEDLSSVLRSGVADAASGEARTAFPDSFDLPSDAETEPQDPTFPTDSAVGSPPAASLNWDDDANPYRQQASELENRFKGLQGSVQRQVEENRALRERQNQLEEALLYQATQHLGPQAQQQRIAEYRAERERGAREQQLAEAWEELERMSRVVALKEIALESGATQAQLAQFMTQYPELAHPAVLKQYADWLKSQNQAQTQQRQQRQTAQMDRFETPGAGSAPARQAPRNLDEAAARLEESMRRRGLRF